MESYRETKKAIDYELKQRQRKKETFVINMNVSDDSNFLSEFSENDTPVISQDVAEFIEASTPNLQVSGKLTLKIKSNCIDEQEKEIYKTAIKEYYTERYISNKRELTRNYIIAASLAMVGVFVLVFAVFLEYAKESVIWAEVIDIVAWVFLWEAVDIAFLETRKIKLDNKKFIAYISMDIIYESAKLDSYDVKLLQA